MKKGTTLLAPVLVFAIAFVCGGWFLQRDLGPGANIYIHARVIDEVMRHIEDDFVDEVDADSLYQAAIYGMVEGLDDPNSRFMAARDWENERIRTQGDYAGVGLEVGLLDGFVTVLAPMPGSPAARAGLLSGDRIVEVDGESVEGRSTGQAVDRLRGEPGRAVAVGVRRPGREGVLRFDVERAVIRVPSVPFATMLEGGIGYVPLDIFNRTTTDEVRAAIDSLATEGMTSLILDLRGNRGGLLTEGVGLTDLFLDRGKPIVEIRGRSTPPEEYLAATAQAYPELPLVLLVSGASASASEILAGALQDHDRALLVGSTTFGKGSVQSIFPVPGGNVLKLTTARWFTPAGRSIQKDLAGSVADAERRPLTVRGEPVQRLEPADRPLFTSAGGRVLRGGGGIVPDLWVQEDTLTTTEWIALEEVLVSANGFFAALQNWAVKYLQQHPGLEPGFEVADSDLADFHASLQERGAELPLETFLRVRSTMAYQMGSQVALLAWEEPGRFRRVAGSDTQLQRAVELLAVASDQSELFALAGSAPAHGLPAPDGSGVDVSARQPVSPRVP